MKNIYVLPTDKPSRLYKQVNKLKLRFIADSPIDSDISINQHIYITSDEEIKEGDWVLGGLGGIDIKKYGRYFAEDWKKIILTSNPDLIADGVQPIDDEFLEWFVKNPSCEEVEVDYDVIVTQTKALLQNQDNKTIAIPHCIHYKIIIPQEEPKQETLEEVAENEASIFYEKGTIEWNKYRQVFELGAKWQQERMYSEEEVIAIVEKSRETGLTAEYLLLTEQFKKK
jgi:hypothetical protein